MKAAEISILIPVYNVERYLSRCIESVLKQDFQDWEMILVDDGSPDKSGAICDEYAQKDARIKVIHKENGGLISARKEGFIHSRGKYLVFLDSDDTLTDGALGILYNNIIKGYDIVKGCVAKTNQKDEIISTEHYRFSEGEIESEEEITKRIFNGDIAPYLCGSIYRRDLFTTEIFEKSIEANISFGEDWITNLLIARNTQKILCIRDIVYNYFVNNESITNSQVVSIKYIERVEKVLQQEGILSKPFLIKEIKIWYSLNRINRFFIPEIGFKYKEYQKVKEIINDKNVRYIIKERINRRFMYFFNCMPLYYIYTKFYCLILYILKQKGKKRLIKE